MVSPFTSSIISQLQKGANGSHADDTKGMKGAILEWIAPDRENLTPYLSRKSKCGQGFNHELTGALLCPTGLDWSDPQYASFRLPLVIVDLPEISAASRKNFGLERCMFVEITGLTSYTQTLPMTLMTLGKGY